MRVSANSVCPPMSGTSRPERIEYFAGIGRNARYLRVLGCYPRKADPSLAVPKDIDLSPQVAPREEAAAVPVLEESVVA